MRRMSDWMRDGVSAVSHRYPIDPPSASAVGPTDVARSVAPRRGAECPILRPTEAHGKRNYVAVFAFETSAFAGA